MGLHDFEVLGFAVRSTGFIGFGFWVRGFKFWVAWFQGSGFRGP